MTLLLCLSLCNRLLSKCCLMRGRCSTWALRQLLPCENRYFYTMLYRGTSLHAARQDHLSMPVQVRKHSAVHEGLAWELCCMLAQQCCAGSPVASPKRARSAILEALQVGLVLCAAV